MAISVEGFDPLELLPADAPVTLDEELEAAIIAAEDDPEQPPAPLGRGWGFSFETGQFNRRGGSPAEVRDIDNLRVWIEKCLRTYRGAHAIYDDNFGTDMPDQGIGSPFAAETVGLLTESIRAALLAHDRIEDVTDFRFTGGIDSDVLFVDFTVLVDDEDLLFNAVPLGESF